jgi:hypothetical protein
VDNVARSVPVAPRAPCFAANRKRHTTWEAFTHQIQAGELS